MGVGGHQIWGEAVNFLPETLNRAGEQARKLPEFPIVLSVK